MRRCRDITGNEKRCETMTGDRGPQGFYPPGASRTRDQRCPQNRGVCWGRSRKPGEARRKQRGGADESGVQPRTQLQVRAPRRRWQPRARAGEAESLQAGWDTSRGLRVPAQADGRGWARRWGLSHRARWRPPGPGRALRHLPWAAQRGLAQIFRSRGRLSGWSSVSSRRAGP